MNKVILFGNLVADVELKFTPSSGVAVASCRLATNEYRKDGQVTEYHNLVFFGKKAETIAEHGVKGMPLLVVGKLNTQSYDKDGITRYITKIIVDEFRFAGGKKGNNNNNNDDVFGQAKGIVNTLTDTFRDEDYMPMDMGDMPF